MAGIRVELELDDGSFTSGIVRANSTLKSFETQVGQSVTSISRIERESRGFLSTLKDVTVVLGLAGTALDNVHKISTGWVGQIVKMNAEVERLTQLLKSMSTAADPLKEANQELLKLRDLAKNAPFSLQAMHDSFVRMKAGGIDPAKGAMANLTDAVAAFGGNDETLKRASLALQEMGGKGVIQMQELRIQLGQAIPSAIQMMARSVGVGYEQLINDIHTGTVSSKEMIAALNLEIERTFGGAAARQMDTFNGQLSRMKVILLDLALTTGGDEKNGFFRKLKDDFKEFNNALDSNVGKKLAESLGSGLSTVLDYVKRGITTVIEFRNEIIRVGEAIAIGFAASAVINFFGSMSRMIIGVRAELALLSTNFSIFQNQMVMNNLVFASQNPLIGVSRSIGSVGLAARNAGAFLPVFASGMAAVAPWLPLILGGIWALAEYFGLFSNKVREAYEEMEKFGARSAEQARQGQEYANQLQRRIELLKQMKAAQEEGSFISEPTVSFTNYEAKIKELQKKLDEVNKNLPEFTKQGQDADAQKFANKRLEVITEAEGKIRREYIDTAIEQEKAHKEARNALVRSQHSTIAEDERYQAQRKQAALDEYEQRLQLYRGLYDEMSKLARDGSEAEQAGAKKTLDTVGERILNVSNSMTEMQKQAMGVTKSLKGMNEEALLQKGKDLFTKLSAEVEGYKAALHGADAEVVALQELLLHMKIGDPAVQSVRNLIDQIVKAKQEATDLNKIVAGGDKLDNDILNTGISLQRKLLELQTEGLSEADKLRVAIASGLYDGFGNARSPAQQRLIDLRKSMQDFNSDSKVTAITVANETFGPTVTTAATFFLDIVTKISGVFSNLKSSARDMNLGAIFGNPNTSSLNNLGLNAFGLNGPRQRGASLSGDDRDLMIRTVIGEAGGESDLGMTGVAHVILNRLMSRVWGDSLSDVIKAPKQFSVWNSGDPAGDMARRVDVNSSAYQRAARIVDLVMSGATEDPTKGARHYYNPSTASPSWGPQLAKENDVTIGNHRFVGTDQTWNKGFTGGPGVAPIYPGDSRLGDPPNLDADRSKRIRDADPIIQEINRLTVDKLIKDKKDEILQFIEESSALIESEGKKYAAIRAAITVGKMHPVDRDPDSTRYRDLLAAARKEDELDKQRDEKQKARTKADGARDGLDKLARDNADAAKLSWQNLKDPYEFQNSKGFIRQHEQLTEYLASVKKIYKEDSDEYIKALEKKTIAETEFRNKEILDNFTTLKKKTDDLRRGLMTDSQAREDADAKEIARLENQLRVFSGSEEEKAEITKNYTDYIATYRQSKLAASPIGNQMKEWSDISLNMQKNFTSAIGSGVDALANMLVGVKVKWSSVLQSMAKDLMTTVLRFSVSSIWKGMTGKLSGLLGGGETKAAGGGLSKFFGTAHTGRIVGEMGGSGMHANIMAFAGAPRFHGGGIIGADEVPIIAKRKEGIFTPEQMAALGGTSNSISLVNNISVSGSAGTPAQNNDLAKQIGDQMERSARAIVADEIRRQMRPGNLLNR
jgi:tape measure domain-containing protein